MVWRNSRLILPVDTRLLSSYHHSSRKTNGPPTNKFQYRTKVPRMAKAVAAALGVDQSKIINVPQGTESRPGVGFQPGQVNTQSYLPIDNVRDQPANGGSNELWTTAMGHLIFDYDPNAGNNQRQWRVLWQRDFLSGDLWTIGDEN